MRSLLARLPIFALLLAAPAGAQSPRLVRKWETEPARQAITVRDLLTHTAGFTYGFNGTSAVDAMYRDKGIDHWNDKESLTTVVDRLATIPCCSIRANASTTVSRPTLWVV